MKTTHVFESYQEVMVTRLTPYLIDLGFRANVKYRVKDYAINVEGMEYVRGGQRPDGLFVENLEGKTVKISDRTGAKLTGAGECFGPYKKKQKKGKTPHLETPFLSYSVGTLSWTANYAISADSNATDALRYALQATE